MADDEIRDALRETIKARRDAGRPDPATPFPDAIRGALQAAGDGRDDTGGDDHRSRAQRVEQALLRSSLNRPTGGQ